MIITKIFNFESAHKLENYDGNCANLHGHSYVLHVSIQGKTNSEGFVLDFKDIKSIVNESIIFKLDHSFLNKVIERPTAENIVLWIWSQLKDRLKLYELRLYETATSYVVYNGD